MTDLSKEFPGAVPQDEAPLASDHPFVDECKAYYADHAEAHGWRYGKSVVTRSDKWGLVWRADVYARDGRRSARLVVYRPEDAKEIFGTAYLQPPPEPLK